MLPPTLSSLSYFWPRQDMQTTTVEYKDQGCSVTAYDLYDTYHGTQIKKDEDQEEEFVIFTLLYFFS